MVEKFNNTYRVPSARLRGYDYSQNGMYFVTICTNHHAHYFGTVETQYLASQNNTQTVGRTQHLASNATPSTTGTQNIASNTLPSTTETQNIESLQNDNKFGPQSQNLASVIRGFKIGVTKFCNSNNIPFGWQTRFHEHIIRNMVEYLKIEQYIINNPSKWLSDCFYQEELTAKI